MFDWLRFLRAHGVHYVTRGPNVGAGQCGVHCPWCGPADPSQHLSISLRGEGYRCWRAPRLHFGKSRSRLIEALLNCAPEEAARLAGEEVLEVPEDQSLSVRLAALMGAGLASPDAKLELPPEAKPLVGPFGLASPFWYYLEDRHLGTWACKRYSLRYATTGRYKYRVIIPVYGVDGALMTWTARSILPSEEVRYRTCPNKVPYDDYDGPLSRRPPGDLLLDIPNLLKADPAELLVVCEGPFDAIKVSALGHKHGIYGTCLFGLNISERQALLIERVAVRFRRVMILLDPDASSLSLRIKDALTCPVVFGKLPHGVEDPGALTPNTFDDFLGRVM